MNDFICCMVSKQVLMFLEWICLNNADMKKFINLSFKNGFADYVANINKKNIDILKTEELIPIFFSFLEEIISEESLHFSKKKINYQLLKKKFNLSRLNIDFSEDIHIKILREASLKENIEIKHISKEIYMKHLLMTWPEDSIEH